MDRKANASREQQRRAIKQRMRRLDAVQFFNVLTGPQLLQTTEEHLPEHRERLYPPTVALSMFLMQALSADGSCQQAVNGWAAVRTREGLKAHSVRTGAYCKARARLPVELIRALTRRTGELVSARMPSSWGWRGRAVKLLDGTTVSMPDSVANQASYPQSSLQVRGVGYPLARVVGVICLASGLLRDAAIGACSGKGGSELALLRELYGTFERTDIALGDALYCNYFVIAALQARAVDVLFEQQGVRITDFRRGQSLGARDHVVNWTRPRRPQWMTLAQYEAVPLQLRVRETRVDGRVLVSTLLNARQVSKQDLQALYCKRWQVELDLRHIKTTLGMEVLSCRTPQMNQKQVWVFLLAYNLIRVLMAQAAQRAQVQPRELSFKHTLQLWLQWSAYGLVHEPEHIERLLLYIAAHRVGNRPGRKEPRMRRRRPKAFPLLKIPRAQARKAMRKTKAVAA